MKKRLLKALICFLVVCSIGCVLTACGESASNHEHVYIEKFVEPTCEEKGKTIHYCKCGQSFEDGYIDELGHKYSTQWNIEEDSTCFKQGKKTLKCLRDGCDYKQVELLPLVGHNLEDGVCLYCKKEIQSEGLTFALNNMGTEYTVTGTGEFKGSQLYIPQTYKNLPVTGIGYGAFNQNTSIKLVYIPKTIKYIADYAFNGCVNVSTVIYDATNVEDLLSDNNAFSYLGQSTKGATVSFCKNVVNIPNYLFYSSTRLNASPKIASISFEKDSKTAKIGNYAFSSLTALVSVSLSDELTEIGKGVFEGCLSLNNMNVPFVGKTAVNSVSISGEEHRLSYFFGGAVPASLKTVTVRKSNIPQKAFYGCAHIETIELISQTEVGEWAFANCSSLKDIYIVDTVKKIGANSFANCSALKTIILPESLTEISNNLFEGCSSLEELGLTSKIKKIGSSAYAKCISVREVLVPDTVVEIGADAFSGCLNLTKITLPFVGKEKEAKSSEASHLFGYVFGTTNTEYKTGDSANKKYNTYLAEQCYKHNSSVSMPYRIPNSLKEITISGGNVGYCAFSDLINVEKITLGANVTSLDVAVFLNCSQNLEVFISEDNANLKLVDDVVYNKNQTKLIRYLGIKNKTALTIPNSVVSIEEKAFNKAKYLQNVYLNNNLKVIGESAFQECVSLTSITIPASVTTIKNGAFRKCSQIREAIFEENSQLESLFDSVFAGCSSLIRVNIPRSIYSISGHMFSECSSLESIVIPENINSIDLGAFYGCVNLKEVIFEENDDIGFGDKAFSCSGLESLEVPYFVSWIGYATFEGCQNLKSVKFEEGSKLIALGSLAFSDCRQLKSIEIPNSLKEFHNQDSFEGCTSLEEISLPFVGQKANGVGQTHFGYIFGAETYSENETYVPTSLKKVVVNGGTIISDNAFSGCSSLVEVQLPLGIEEVGSRAFFNCTSLETLDLPSSLKLIGYYAFYSCASLKSIEISENVERIDSGTFYGCNSLISITLPFAGESLTADGGFDEVFGYVFGFTSSTEDTLHGAICQYVSDTGNQSFTKYYHYYIPATLKSVTILNGGNITGVTFKNCSQLTNIEIKEATSFASYAFRDCSSLISITLPFVGESLTANEGYDQVFGWVFGITKVEDLLNGFKEVPGATYQIYVDGYYCHYYIPTSLKSVVILGGDSIYKEAFCNCSSLTSVTIGSGVTSIGNWAFNSCSSLESITIAKNVESIGGLAFAGCELLKDIVYLGTINEWNTIALGHQWSNRVLATNVTCVDGDVSIE